MTNNRPLLASGEPTHCTLRDSFQLSERLNVLIHLVNEDET